MKKFIITILTILSISTACLAEKEYATVTIFSDPFITPKCTIFLDLGNDKVIKYEGDSVIEAINKAAKDGWEILPNIRLEEHVNGFLFVREVNK